MVHPALRQIDLTPPWQDDPVEEQDQAAECPVLHPYPESPLLGEMNLLASAQAVHCRTFLLRSQFDKAGLGFPFDQRDSPKHPGVQLPTGMLGRIGLVGNAAARALYDPTTARAKICSIWVGQHDGLPMDTDGTQTDFWHVDLFGWELPGMAYRSRFIFDRNIPSGRVDESNFAHGTLRSGWEVSNITEVPPWHQIALPQPLINRAWIFPRLLLQQGGVASP